MTETDSAGLKRTSGNRWGLTAAVLGIAVILGLFGACVSNQDVGIRTGDEPPIRVRNGSLEIQLVHRTLKFEEDGNSQKKKWKIRTEPLRLRNNYLVIVLPGNPSSCPSGFVTSGDKVDVVYSADSQEIEFKSTGRKTKITAKEALVNQTGSEEFLRYGVSGYITAIRVGGDDFCTFSGPDGALQVFLID